MSNGRAYDSNNHILRAKPATFYMHVVGHGDPEKMAMSRSRGWGD